MFPTLSIFGLFHLHLYGVLVALGVLAAVLVIQRNAPRAGVARETAGDLAMATVVSGFIGARIFYVIQFWDYFRADLLDIIKIWEGGIVVYGGILGGLAGFLIFVRLKRLPFLPSLDLFMAPLALAQAVGRIGCFLNGCCYGLPPHSPQLYESGYCLALSAVLFRFWKKNLKPGTVSLVYFILYPAGRFVIEFFRADNARMWLNLTLAQWISIVLVVTSTFILTTRSRSHDPKANHRPA